MTTNKQNIIQDTTEKKIGITCLRIRLKKWDDIYLYATDMDNGKDVTAAYSYISYCHRLKNILKTECRLNLLDCSCGENMIVYPKEIIFEPDFLIEITSLCNCNQEYGSSPLNYILNLFKDNAPNKYTLLGEAANLFLDNCINEQPDNPVTYNDSMSVFFREYPLQLTAADGIDGAFFEETKRQFTNIRYSVNRLLSPMNDEMQENIYIEPSFFCAALGLQGRIDLLENNNIIELKSGKADEFRKSAKTEHILQMSLYKKMLEYNMKIPKDNIHAHLLYSRYPNIIHQESSSKEISDALMLRNEIVSALYRLADNTLRNVLESITPDDFNTLHTTSVLWCKYKRPELETLLSAIWHADKIMKEYFFENIAFIAREMRVGKTGGGADTAKGGFAETWNYTVNEKISNGNIFTNLRIEKLIEEEGVSKIMFKRPTYDDDFFPNFRAGDTVFIYVTESKEDNATNKQVTRGTLISLTPDCIIFKLRHKQRNPHMFPLQNTYAMEHDFLDSTIRANFKDVYSLLLAPKRRRDLLLAEREPEFDKSRTLYGNYGNCHINEIVLKAKQAKDLFLLVGPPGTGKTSQALSSMVKEFYADSHCNILLASFTNRAVDEICQALENMSQKTDYIRIGNEHACAEEYTNKLLKNAIKDCTRREQINNVLQSARIIVGTISSLSGRQELFRMKKFDVAIIDEATQILETQLAGLFAAKTSNGESAIEKFILIGDPKQLPAVVAQPIENTTISNMQLRERGITSHAVSFFERIYRYYKKHSLPELTASLYAQGRMHPEVGNFANKYFYNNILKPIPLPHQTEKLPYEKYDEKNECEKILATRRVAFIPTKASSKGDNPKINRHEAKTIAAFVAAYETLCNRNGIKCNLSEQIGIIVPFRNQIAMVTNEIARLNINSATDIIIDTVERFQGSQRDIIFYGTTVSSPEMTDILSVTSEDENGTLIDRKLNVAITRARCQLFIFGVPEALSRSALYTSIMEEMRYEKGEKY